MIGANRGGRRLGFLEAVVAGITYLVAQVACITVAIIAFGIQPDQLLEGGEGTPVPVATAAASALVAALVANVIRIRSLAAIGLVGTTGRRLVIGAGLAAYLVNRIVVVLYVWLSGDVSYMRCPYPRPAHVPPELMGRQRGADPEPGSARPSGLACRGSVHGGGFGG